MNQEKILAILERFNSRMDTSEVSLAIKSESRNIDFDWLSEGSKKQHFIASTTKTFATALLMRLETKGLLKIDNALIEYLPKSQLQGLNVYKGVDYFDTLTIRDLLTQVSGIPNYYSKKALKPSKLISQQTAADPGWDYQEALEIAKSLKASFAPGGPRAEYSFTNYQILSELIEVVSGKSLAEAFETEIFEPLGLNDTFLFTKDNLNEFENVSKVLYGTQDYLGDKRMASLRAEGAIISTNQDVMAFAKAFFEEDLITPEQKKQARTTFNSWAPFMDYGMGVMRFRFPRILSLRKAIPEMIGHSGATGHFMFWVPENDTYIVGTVNQIQKPFLGMRFLFQVAKALA